MYYILETNYNLYHILYFLKNRRKNSIICDAVSCLLTGSLENVCFGPDSQFKCKKHTQRPILIVISVDVQYMFV